MAGRQTSVNLNVSSSTDGFALSGGNTERRLTISKGDITMDGGSGNVYQFPNISDTLVGTVATQSLENKIITGSFQGGNVSAIEFTSSNGLSCQNENVAISVKKGLHIQLDSDNNNAEDGIFIYKDNGLPGSGTFVMAFNGFVHGRGTDIYLVSGSAPSITVASTSQLVHYCGSAASASMASVVWGSGSTPPSNVPTGTIYFQL